MTFVLESFRKRKRSPMCIKLLTRAYFAVSGTISFFMNQKQFLKNPFTIRSRIMRSYKSLWLSLLGLGLLFSLFVLPFTVKGQEITENFDLGADPGWQHYTPTTSGGATPTFTFPTNSPGDLGYELFAPAMNCEGLLQRGAAVRSEQYQELFYSVDFLNYAPTFGS